MPLDFDALATPLADALQTARGLAPDAPLFLVVDAAAVCRPRLTRSAASSRASSRSAGA